MKTLSRLNDLIQNLIHSTAITILVGILLYIYFFGLPARYIPDILTTYCPKCGSYNIDTKYVKRLKQDIGTCNNCCYSARYDNFKTDY